MRKSLGKRVSRGRGDVLHLWDIFLCSSWDMPMFWSSLGCAVDGGTTEDGHGWGCRWGGHGLRVKADWAQRRRSVRVKALGVIKRVIEFWRFFFFFTVSFFSSCKLFPTSSDVWICVVRACLEFHWNQRVTFAFLAARTRSDLWGLLSPTHAKPLERGWLPQPFYFAWPVPQMNVDYFCALSIVPSLYRYPFAPLFFLHVLQIPHIAPWWSQEETPRDKCVCSVTQAAAYTVYEEFNRCLESLNQNNKHVCLYF